MASQHLPDYRPAEVTAEFGFLLDDIKREAISRWGTAFLGALQFGSTVEQIKPVTDLDLLLVLENATGSQRVRNGVLEPFEAALHHRLARLHEVGCHMDISPILRAPQELGRFMPIYLDFPHRSRILHDPDGILAVVGAHRKPHSGNGSSTDTARTALVLGSSSRKHLSRREEHRVVSATPRTGAAPPLDLGRNAGRDESRFTFFDPLS